MKRFLTITTALCLATAAAHAGNSNHDPAPGGSPTYNTATQTTVAVAAARAQAAAQSRSVSWATGGSATAQGGAGGRAVSRSAGGSATGGTASNGNQTMNYSGGSTSYSARGNTPNADAPSIVGGNLCTVGASAALSLAGIGLGGGASTESANCVLRQNIALLYNMGHQVAATKLACSDPWMAYSLAMAGEPCDDTRNAWVKAGWRQLPDGRWAR